MYVWTKKAEELARERRQAERKAGTEATWGGRPKADRRRRGYELDPAGAGRVEG